MDSSIVVLGEGDLDWVAALMAKAFVDYPFYEYIEPDAVARSEAIVRHYSNDLGETLALGGSMGDADRRAATVWLRSADLQAGGFIADEWYLDIWGAAAGRFAEVFAGMATMAPFDRGDFWYLDLLGTEPEIQGHGVGARLLRAGLDRCDAQGIPAYLETAKHTTVGFYQRHGFELIGDVSFSSDLTIHGMWRPAV